MDIFQYRERVWKMVMNYALKYLLKSEELSYTGILRRWERKSNFFHGKKGWARLWPEPRYFA